MNLKALRKHRRQSRKSRRSKRQAQQQTNADNSVQVEAMASQQAAETEQAEAASDTPLLEDAGRTLDEEVELSGDCTKEAVSSNQIDPSFDAEISADTGPAGPVDASAALFAQATGQSYASAFAKLFG